MHKLLGLCLLATLTSGCFISRDTINEPLVRERIAALNVGTSNSTEVADLLGAPNEVVQLGNRYAWRYDFTAKKSAGFTLFIVTFINTDQRADRAWLFFDAKNVLESVGTTLEAGKVEYAMPWMDVHE